MSVALAVAGIVLFVGGIFWFLAWNKKKIREAVQGAANLLGLSPWEMSDDEDGWKVSEAYRGTVEGMDVVLALGSKVVDLPSAGTATQINGVLVQARAPEPARFSYEVKRFVWGIPRSFEHSDNDFNKHCAVVTQDEKGARALLEDRGLRLKIKSFLQDGKGSAAVADTGTFTIIFNAQFAKAEGTARQVRDAISIARALHERTKKLGLLR